MHCRLPLPFPKVQWLQSVETSGILCVAMSPPPVALPSVAIQMLSLLDPPVVSLNCNLWEATLPGGTVM